MIPLLREIREEFLSFYPEPIRPLVEAALPTLELQAVRLGMEVLDAEHRGVAFADAVGRLEDSPLMARVHYGIIDFLQFEIPNESFEMLRSAFESVQSWDKLEDVRRLLFYRAALDPNRIDSAFLRFLFYEGIRLNLWLLTWKEPTVEALGCLSACDREAETVLRERLRQAEMFDEDVRPLNVLVGDAACRLREQFESACTDLKSEAKEMIGYTTGLLLRAVEEARTLNAADAALLRNAYAPAVELEPLGSVRLSERHPHLFPSSQAVDTRWSRLPQKLQGSRRVRRRMIDLFVPIPEEAAK